MKKYLLGLALIFSTCFAQEVEIAIDNVELLAPKLEIEQIIPTISADTFFEVGTKAFFDATETKKVAPSYGQISMSWDFGDGSRMLWGEKITHIYEKPGIYTVILHVKQGKFRETVSQDVTIYNRKALLISTPELEIDDIISQAGHHGIWLRNVKYESEGTGFSSETEFIRKIQEKIELFKDSEIIIFYSKSISPLQSFAQFWQKLSEENRFDLKEKLWIQISEDSLDKVAKIIQPIFSILKPNFMLLTRVEGFNSIFGEVDNGEVLEKLNSRAIEHVVIDERSATPKLFVFSNLITYFVTNGISQNVIYLLLAVPFIAFTIAFFRQFVGIFTFGVYSPLMLSVSFLVLGLEFGLIVFSVVMLVSYGIRSLFEKVELLYIPKVSLLLSFIALSFFFVLGLAIYFDSSINITFTIFPMLVMATLSEKFLSAQSASGLKYALISAGETLLVALLAYFFVTWSWLESAILALPELIIVPILLIVWLGKFTGLRLSEYFKFRALFREDSQEEE